MYTCTHTFRTKESVTARYKAGLHTGRNVHVRLVKQTDDLVMSTRGSGSVQFQKSLPQWEYSLCRNGAVLGPRFRPVQHHWGQYLMKNVSYKMFGSRCQYQIFRGQQMRGKQGRERGVFTTNANTWNARHVHTDAWNMRSMIHILQIHTLCCCRLQQRQVEHQCAHKEKTFLYKWCC